MHEQKISLVIPVRDEAETMPVLLESIRRQTLPPNETVIVDGGSVDGTCDVIEKLASGRDDLRLVRTAGATPGKGRNLGVEAAASEWIAFTDAGIRLENDWLEQLAAAAEPDADLVLGNYAPVTDSFFTRCAALAYVPAQQDGMIRGKFIASSLIRRKVCEQVGGFPDLRAAEDLIFIENVEKSGAKVMFAPRAMVHWQLRPDLASTFAKFVLYSNRNVLAGRQWDWHYGILRQYAFLLPFLILAAVHNYWWLMIIPFWLIARTAKRILPYRSELGAARLLDPIQFAFTAFLIIFIDIATVVGWMQALSGRKPGSQNG